MVRKFNILFFTALLIFWGCHNTNESHEHSHNEHSHEHAETADHDHDEELTHFTVYTNNLEIYIVGKPLIMGEESELLAHLTNLNTFKPAEIDSIGFEVKFDNKEYHFHGHATNTKGIYHIHANFDFNGEAQGKLIVYNNNGETNDIDLGKFEVYHCEHDFEDAHEHHEIPNSIHFSKEQAWSVDFATTAVNPMPMGMVIRTSGRVMPAQSDERVITAGASGVVNFLESNVYEGLMLKKANPILRITSSGTTDDNFLVRYTEAKNRFEIAKAQYERQKALAVEKIVSEAELQNSLKEYEVAKAAYQTIVKGNSLQGQLISSPFDGEVTSIFVSNGEYVSAGQPLIKLARLSTQKIQCYVQPKYIKELGNINDANIRIAGSSKTLNLHKIGGRIVSVGRTITSANHLIPVTLEIPYTENVPNGEIAEVYLLCKPAKNLLTVPKTALLEAQGNYFVMVQHSPETFVKREVKLGISDGVRVEVLSGLKPGERVVTRGAIYVKMAQSSGALDAHSGHIH
ncbi:efflux RND transporter periplasmic adaptor subunit [Tenuifilum thalassicum]|uniref:Efflux RND transporter periplasmic adaptor subunit n=1 Tax=Tenuifilum thalassicum TaxID=2590900 RepID=A0A7D3XEX1_9BACT|nr:efflux RND transporter periplasmic adaptor subunit [Tenuifilum thalassicum]QKG80307.1 efflux RND transporter periplasmic adaptor subunit [Tenuifilum thalassicum]